MSNETDTLWRRLRGDGDAEARAQLLERHIGLVHHCARGIARRIGGTVDVDDLVGAGMIGLVKAVESFDVERGLAFSTYAVQRVRGAILDELRAIDWLPRSMRAKGRQLDRAAADLERALGRAPHATEVATALEIDLETYWRWREEVRGGRLVSLEAPVTGADGSQGHVIDVLSDPSAPGPDDDVTREESVRLLREAIEELPDRERIVLALYYYEDMTLRQISEILRVTESRISQIRSQALGRLRGRFMLAEAV